MPQHLTTRAHLCAAIFALGLPAQSAPENWMHARVLETGSGALAYDLARQRAVLFVGPVGETWEWDGSVWAVRFTPVAPPARMRGAVAYDVARQRTVLFGGATAHGFLFADTWEWDGVAWSECRPVSAPPARYWHALAYDQARQKTVLFGGAGGEGGGPVAADTWEWDGTAWTRRAPVPAPDERYAHSMAYDAARQRTVLYGGTNGWSDPADTWEYDGTTWTRHAPSFGPGSLAGAMAYDVARRRTVLHGSGYTFEWDGVAWTRRTPAVSPNAVVDHTMAYDIVRQRTVLFGGGDTSYAGICETWEWDGSNWTLMPTQSDTPVSGWMADDGARQRVVLLGSGTGTFEWDGLRWSRRAAAASSPAGPIAWDGARGRVVAFGAGTSEWDGSSWRLRQPATSPAVRGRSALAYDAARQRVVLFGGATDFPSVYFSDTWEWDGTTWSRAQPAVSPPPRAGHALAYDSARQRVVLFGGSDGNGRLSDTWEWDGQQWQRRTPATSPPARESHAMAYDTVARRVVLFGGMAFSWYTDTWEWDGTSWLRRQPAASLPSVPWATMAYDKARQRLVSMLMGTTWLYGRLNPATARTLGSACAGAGGPPVLDSTAPYLGSPGLLLDLLRGRASAPCVFGLAARPQSQALGGGCTLYLLDPIAALPALTNETGFASARLAVPFDRALVGATLHAQAFVVDPQGAALGLAFSARRELVLGE